MDVGKSFGYVFEDQEWIRKLLLASALVFLSIITFGLAAIPLSGWQIEVSRRVIRGTEPTLPGWDDFGAMIRDGLKVFVGGLVWALPMIVLFGCISTIGAFTSNQNGQDAVSALSSILSLCIGLPYSLIVALLFPAYMGQIADHGELGRAINPVNAFRALRANPAGYVITLLIIAIVAPIIQSVGVLLCVIGVLPASAYTTALAGHLFGQAYRDAQAAMPAPAM